jgi:hypothetical protein
MMRNPVELHTHAHGDAVCRTLQISDGDFGGRSSKIGSALASARHGGATNGAAAKRKAGAAIVKGTTPAK